VEEQGPSLDVGEDIAGQVIDHALAGPDVGQREDAVDRAVEGEEGEARQHHAGEQRLRARPPGQPQGGAREPGSQPLVAQHLVHEDLHGPRLQDAHG
jgi:hypothetical protein